MDKLRKEIMFIDKSTIFAGAEFCLLSLCKNIDISNFDTSIVCDYPLDHQKKYIDNSVRIHYRNSNLKFWMGKAYSLHAPRGSDFLKRIIFAIQLAFILKKNKIDIVHINLLRGTDYLDIKIAKLLGCSVIGHVRSLENQVKIPSNCLEACDYLICTSDFVLNEVKRPKISNRVKRIYDPIDVENYNAKNINIEDVKDKYGIKKDQFVLSSIAILDRRKGHDTAIRVFKKLFELNTNSVLLVAGGSISNLKEEERLKKIANELNIIDNVIFTGHVDNIVEIFAITDIVLALSRDGEAFGRVPLEAASARKVVIATNLAATPEIVVDKKTGFLVEPDNELQIIASVLDLVKNRNKMETVSENAFNNAFKNFRASIHSDLVEKLYNNILAK